MLLKKVCALQFPALGDDGYSELYSTRYSLHKSPGLILFLVRTYLICAGLKFPNCTWLALHKLSRVFLSAVAIDELPPIQLDKRSSMVSIWPTHNEESLK